MVNTCIYIR